MDGQSYSRILGSVFYGMFYIGLSIGLFLAAIILVILKLFGVLALSWLFIVGFVPAVLVTWLIVKIIFAGIKSVFGK